MGDVVVCVTDLLRLGWVSSACCGALRRARCAPTCTDSERHLRVIRYKMDYVILLMAEILHQLIGGLSHYLHGFIHLRWCRISAINSTTETMLFFCKGVVFFQQRTWNLKVLGNLGMIRAWWLWWCLMSKSEMKHYSQDCRCLWILGRVGTSYKKQ